MVVKDNRPSIQNYLGAILDTTLARVIHTTHPDTLHPAGRGRVGKRRHASATSLQLFFAHLTGQAWEVRLVVESCRGTWAIIHVDNLLPYKGAR